MLSSRHILRRVDLVQSHELDEAETASRVDPTPLMIRPHEVVDEQQNSCLHMLDICKFGVAVLGL